MLLFRRTAAPNIPRSTIMVMRKELSVELGKINEKPIFQLRKIGFTSFLSFSLKSNGIALAFVMLFIAANYLLKAI